MFHKTPFSQEKEAKNALQFYLTKLCFTFYSSFFCKSISNFCCPPCPPKKKQRKRNCSLWFKLQDLLLCVLGKCELNIVRTYRCFFLIHSFSLHLQHQFLIPKHLCPPKYSQCNPFILKSLHGIRVITILNSCEHFSRVHTSHLCQQLLRKHDKRKGCQ